MKVIPFVIEKQNNGFLVSLVDGNQHKLDFTDKKELNDYLTNNDYFLAGFKPDRELLKIAGLTNRFTELSQDMDKTLNPTAVYAHLGFNLEADELEKVSCLFSMRTTYLTNKIEIGKLAGLDKTESLTLTEPQLMACVLGAQRRPVFPNEFMTPNCIDWNCIDSGIQEFVSKGCNGKHTSNICGIDVTYGQGGVHGAIPHCKFEETDTRAIWLIDVSSMYPSIMANYGYQSRAISDTNKFKILLEKRLTSKSTNPALATALKSPLNKTYGAMKCANNALYDPTMALAVCVTGQLLMTVLLSKLSLVDGLRVLQVNTDGVIIELDKCQIGNITKAINDWEDCTHLKLETTVLKKIIQKDVSNYIAVADDGSVKAKGSLFSKGEFNVGAWKLNYSNLAISTAIVKYFVDGVAPEETIENCDLPQNFQIIVNVSDLYPWVYHETFGGDIELSKCNRVFASFDKKLGTITKAKVPYRKEAIPNLPKHCFVSNKELPPIESIDKSFYVEQAKSLIKSFL